MEKPRPAPLRRLLPLLLLLLACHALPALPANAAVPIMPSRDLRPGMKGYGLTVFRGTRVVRFPVVVLGVIRHFLAESDLILIRVTGGYPAQHGVGIVAGMSGSPVYVNGRLIGAVAYGWPFSKEPVGGVTPIESMLKELPDRRPAAPAAALPGPRPLGRALAIDGRTFRQVQLMRNDDPGVRQAAPDTMVLTPVPSLLQIQGFNARTYQRLAHLLKPLDMEPLRTFSMGGPVPTKAPRLVPGSAVGVQLLTGDLDISGTGTLTWLDRKQFLAFGHPMSQMGKVAFPFTAAYIQDVLPSYVRPFKFASQIKAVGELSTDEYYAVGGWLGRRAPMVPVRIRIEDRAGGVHKTYRLKACQNRLLTPAILSAAVAEAVGSIAPSGAASTAILHYRVRPHGRAPIALSQMVSSPAVDVATAMAVGESLNEITDNDFQPMSVDGLDVNVDLVPGRRTATIERLYTERESYRPGDEMAVHVVLKPYGKPSVEKVVRLPIPPDLDKGTVTVGVAGGSDMVFLRKRMAELPPAPTSVSQILERLRTEPDGQDLVIRAGYPSAAATVSAERFPFLPAALREILPGLHQSDVGSTHDFVEKRLQLPWVVHGTEVIQEAVGGATPAPTTPTPSPGFVWTGDEPAQPLLHHTGRRDRLIVNAAHTVKGSHATITAPAITGGGPPEKLLPSGTRRFDLNGESDLSQGTFEATSLSDGGELALAPQATAVSASQGEVLWTLAPDGAGFLVGGTHGAVLAMPAGQTRAHRLFQVADMAVTALARLPGGRMVGTAPHGRIFYVPDGGAPQPIHGGPERYVWALLPRPDGSVLAATGDPAVVYSVTPAGACRVVATLPARHVRALAAAPDGTVYLATADPGAVYALAPGGGDPQALFSSPYGSVDALLVEKDGTLAAASDKSVFLWKPDHHLQEIPVADHPLLALAAASDGALLAGGGGGVLYRVAADGTTTRLLETQAGAITGLARQADEAIAITAGPGRVVTLNGSVAPQGTWTSPVMDAGGVARWGRLRWMSAESGGTVALQTRSGFTPQPDASWSAWSSDLTDADGENVSSPAARYLQVRARLAAAGANSPRVGDISVFFRGEERDPVVALDAPAGGARLSGTVKLQWKVTGGAPARMAYDLDYTADGGKTWKPIKSRLLPTLVEVAGGGAAERGAPVQSDSYSWDTRKLPDGTYAVRVKVLDGGAARATAVSDPIVLANTAPAVSITSRQKQGDDTVLHGVAQSHLAWIVSVTWRQGKGDWQVAQSDSGLYDSDRAAFTITAPGHDEVEIKATDEAGNSKTIKAAP